MATYLTKKPGESTWYVRMAVPADVRKAFGGRAKLIKTTGTSNKAEAMDKRLPILSQWKADIRAARAARTADREEWRQILHIEALDHRQQVDSHLIEAVRNPPKSSANPTIQSTTAQAAKIDADIHALLRDFQEIEDTTGAVGLVEMARNNFLEDHKNATEATVAIDKLFQHYMSEMARTRYHLSMAETIEAKSIISKPTDYKPVSPITAPRLAAFRAYREKSGVADKTIDQQESKLKKLSDYLRDQGSPLTRATVAAWLDTMSLSSKTKAQYLLAGSTFWQWAIKHDSHWRSDYSEKDSPFTGQELPKVRAKDKAESARKAFTAEEIESLYAAAKLSGGDTLCDLIMLGSYTGCRIEEIAQLHKNSIITVEGIRTFKITDSKTVAGIREIPIHPSLAEVVDRLIDESTDGFLLPSSSGNKYGIRSDPLSKAFGRLKKTQGFGSRQVFHSVRSMVITLLLRAGVPGPTVANIVGHETGLVTFDIYDEGASPKQKQAALSNLCFNFNC